MLKRRETRLQNMVYMAIMAAINAIFSLLSCINGAVGFFAAFGIIVLPVLSALVTIFCNKKYYPLYIVVTFIVCFLSTYFLDPTFSLFAVLPSLITGFVCGLLLEIGLEPFYPLLSASVIQFLLNIAMIPIINKLTSSNLNEIFLTIFNLKDKGDLGNNILPSFILLLSFIEMTLSYIVIDKCLEKLRPETKTIYFNEYIFDIVFGVGLIFFILFTFLKIYNVALIFFFILLFITIYDLVKILMSKIKLRLIFYSISVVIGIVMLISFYNMTPKPYGIFLISTGFICAFIEKLSFDIYTKYKRKNI